MEPCDKCTKEKNCSIERFVKKYSHRHPWDLDSLLREYTVEAQIVRAEGSEITIECSVYQPSKPEYDYSYLVNRPRREPDDVKIKPACCGDKCGDCSCLR